MRDISAVRKQVEEKNLRRSSGKRSGKTAWRRCFAVLMWGLDFFLTVSFLKRFGVKCAFDLKVEEVEFIFPNLPANFDGMKILFITDLHIGAIEGLCEKVLETVEGLEYDCCILGGDYLFSWRKEDRKSYSVVSGVGGKLCERSRVFGVLGNHDLYNIGQVLEDRGVEMLLNEHVCIEKNGERVYVCGIDDHHHYKADDIVLAGEGIGEDEFKIIVAHSPCQYTDASARGYSLYLAGHTHGGQICLPGGFALATNTIASRKVSRGKWQHKGMGGYTSRGVGVTGIGVRFFCSPEVTLITLRRGD